MNFFEQQDRARRKTGVLVALLVAAVSCLIAITIFAVGVFLYFVQNNSTSVGAYNAQQQSLSNHFWYLLQSPITAWIALAVVTVVTIGGLYKFFQLGSSGRSVAQALGGRLINSNTRDLMERKILNVVEEMAIASGNPVPPVYIMEEPGINAFAAGLDRRNAVIGVTRGCVNLLNRDELQGVMAHEFSHIHNGDMRLNLRLIAILHGILLIGLIGYYIAYGASIRSYGRSRDRDGRQVSLGLALMAIGYGGTFFGNVIKAAVSRQREFLADASAVQFTRNPTGISGALKKIGGFSQGSVLENAKAAEFSHLYFGQGIRTAFSFLMATHPPLSERIKRIEPRWQGKFPQVANEPVYDATSAEEGSPVSHFAKAEGKAEGAAVVSAAAAASILDSVGDPHAEHVARADQILADIPRSLHEASHEAFSARALVYGLLLDRDIVMRDQQLSELQNKAHPATYKELTRHLSEILTLPRHLYLPLLSLCIPALKTLSDRQYEVFKQNLITLIKADNKVTLFEWSLYRIASKNIEAKAVREKYRIEELRDAVINLLAATSIAGKNRDQLAALNRGLAALKFNRIEAFPQQISSLQHIDKALDKLESLKALEKPKLLKALVEVISADGAINIQEKELFRAVADTLNCPVPPLGE